MSYFDNLPEDLILMIYKKKHNLEMLDLINEFDKNYINSLYGVRHFSCSLYHLLECTNKCNCRNSKERQKNSFKYIWRLETKSRYDYLYYNNLEPYNNELLKSIYSDCY